MEGVGARLGRSSTRYGPTTVFSGPVRKWKKRWVHVANPNNNTAAAAANGNGTGNNNSHLLLYKWTPLSSSSSQGNAAGATAATGAGAGAGKGSTSAAPEAPAEEPPRRKFRYVPVYVIEEQKQLEDATKADDEAMAKDGDPSSQPTQSGGSDDKPDVNDVLMEEAQALNKDRVAHQEASEANLDLSLGLKSHDGERKVD